MVGIARHAAHLFWGGGGVASLTPQNGSWYYQNAVGPIKFKIQ